MADNEGTILDAIIEIGEQYREGGIARDVYRDEMTSAVKLSQGDWTPVTSEGGRVTFTPWTDGFAVGFRVENRDTGKVRYVYLNPSTDDGTERQGDAGTVFLYLDATGGPESGETVCYLDTLDD